MKKNVQHVNLVMEQNHTTFKTLNGNKTDRHLNLVMEQKHPTFKTCNGT